VNQIVINQTIQYVAWFLALAGLIVGLYILTLNPQNSANRYVGIFLLICSVNTYATGMMVTAVTVLQGTYSAVILAMTTSMTEPLLLLSSVSLLRPEWLKSKKRWIWVPVYALVFLPAILTVFDLIFRTQAWFTGIDSTAYTGGFLISPDFTDGFLSWVVRVGFILCFVFIFLFLLYVALFDKHSTRKDRNLAWLLLVQQFLAGAVLSYGAQVIQPSITILITNTIFVLTYAFAAFTQMISARNQQKGTLQSRLITVILIVAIPVMVASTALIIDRAKRVFELTAYQKLSSASNLLGNTYSRQFESFERSLTTMASQREIWGMDPAIRISSLEQYIRLNPEITETGIIDLYGNSISSLGGPGRQDISGMDWFQQIKSGKHIVYQVFNDNTFNKPSLVSAVPILDRSEQLIGVLFSAIALNSFNEKITPIDVGTNGRALIFNDKDELIVENGVDTSIDTQDWSNYPPINQLRNGVLGPITYTDNQGIRWRAKSELLANGWGVVAEYHENDLLGPLFVLIRIGWFSLMVATLLLVIMAVLMIRQTIRPIRNFSDAAAAVAGGDLTQVISYEGEDEVGELAASFNKMTNQVSQLVGNLEQSVVERTADLEHRAVQLQVAAQVAREAAAIHDPKTLLDHTANLISEKFGFYHAGIFMLDDVNQYAVLMAASSPGGHHMLARGHKLKVGETGIVGFVARSGEPRIALDVGKDAVFFNNPDLPETHSEMALPMKAKGKVVGVLDVQSTKPAAFKDEDVTILQVLADQITLAIENARLLHESNQSLRELETLYRQQMEQAWEQRLKHQPISFKYDGMGVNPVVEKGSITPPRNTVTASKDSGKRIDVPIVLRGFPIGSLELSRDNDSVPWTPQEIEVVKATATQIGLALENSRLQETERRRMQKEQIANEISVRVQSSLDLETVMKRSVQEIGQTLKVDKVQIRLVNNDNGSDRPNNGGSG
jgi:GAF domain-containing protein/HAMP domain-containing protein